MYNYPSESPQKQGLDSDAEFQQYSSSNQSSRPQPPPLPYVQQNPPSNMYQQSISPPQLYSPQMNHPSSQMNGQSLQTQIQYAQPHQQQYSQPQQQYFKPQYPQQNQNLPQHQSYMIIENKNNQLILPRQLDNYSGPTQFHCPSCNHESVSLVSTTPGSGTYTCCCLLCCCTCVLCPLPFFLDQCQDVKHACPVCGAQVGLKAYKIC